MKNLERTMKVLEAESGDTLRAIARLVMFQEAHLRRIRRDMAKSKPGSATRMAYHKLLGHEVRAQAELLCDLGYFPKHLGSSETNYMFRSVVSIGGAVSTERVPTIDAEFPLLKP